MDFYYRDLYRWTLGLRSPNECGLLLAQAAPFAFAACLWAGRPRAAPRTFVSVVGHALALLLSAGLWWLIAKTYSRGGALAAAGAGLVFIGLAAGGTSPRAPGALLRTALLWFALAAACIQLAGLGHRFSEIGGGDRSAWNRVPLWRGGLRMIGAAPLTGWGTDRSGLEFMQWFQDPAEPMIYGGMVNSYLTFAVEEGIPAFLLLTTAGLGCLGLMAASLSAGRLEYRLLMSAVISASVAFAIASIFSTFWKRWYLVFPEVCLLVAGTWIAARRIDPRTKRRAVLAAAGIGVGLSAALTGSGQILNRRAGIGLHRDSCGRVTLFETGTSPHEAAKVVLVPDNVTLGKFYGRPIRAWLTGRKNWDRLTVYPPGEAGVLPGFADQIYLFGDRAELLDRIPAPRRLVLVAPAGRNPAGARPLADAIYFPAIRLTDSGPSWAACLKQGGTIHRLDGVGQNVVAYSDRIFAPAFTELR